MYYFLCEGAEDKAEYIFIKRVIEEFHTNEEYKLYSAEGNEGIDHSFEVLNNEFSTGDIFILFFDKVGEIKERQVAVILKEMQTTCDKSGVIFRHTTYYCFEELFLSYAGLVAMVRDGYKSELQSLQEFLMSDVDYWKESNLSFWLNTFPNLRSATTREQFSAGLLWELTNRVRGNFRIIKSSIGSCWITCCEKIREKDKISVNKCASCSYDCKNCSFRKKLEMLDKNSVSSFSLPFSTIFWHV